MGAARAPVRPLMRPHADLHSQPTAVPRPMGQQGRCRRCPSREQAHLCSQHPGDSGGGSDGGLGLVHGLLHHVGRILLEVLELLERRGLVRPGDEPGRRQALAPAALGAAGPGGGAAEAQHRARLRRVQAGYLARCAAGRERTGSVQSVGGARGVDTAAGGTGGANYRTAARAACTVRFLADVQIQVREGRHRETARIGIGKASFRTATCCRLRLIRFPGTA